MSAEELQNVIEALQKAVADSMGAIRKDAEPVSGSTGAQATQSTGSDHITDIQIRVGPSGAISELSRPSVRFCIGGTCQPLGPMTRMTPALQEPVQRIAQKRGTTTDQVLREAEGNVLAELVKQEIARMDKAGS